MIAKGHCQAWILLAWCVDGAILSNTYTFYAGMGFQGQNVGTEIATEELCRTLTGFKEDAVTDSVKIWCGTFGSLETYTKNGITVTVPSHYYKVISYHDSYAGKDVLLTWWMPNDPTEKRSKLEDRMVSYPESVARLDFNPQVFSMGSSKVISNWLTSLKKC
jgi:DNA/RNA endonuclease G (NUC1)